MCMSCKYIYVCDEKIPYQLNQVKEQLVLILSGIEVIKKIILDCKHFCLTWFFTSHQQSFSYVGMGLPGLNQYKARINVSCSIHNTVMLVRLEPAAPRSRVNHSTTEPSTANMKFQGLIKLKYWNIKILTCLIHSNGVYILLINVKMPTIVAF